MLALELLTLKEVLLIELTLACKPALHLVVVHGLCEVTAARTVLLDDDITKRGEADAKVATALEHIFSFKEELGVDGLLDRAHLDESFEDTIFHESDDLQYFSIRLEDLMDIIQCDRDTSVEDRDEEDVVGTLMTLGFRGSGSLDLGTHRELEVDGLATNETRSSIITLDQLYRGVNALHGNESLLLCLKDQGFLHCTERTAYGNQFRLRCVGREASGVQNLRGTGDLRSLSAIKF